MKTFSIYMGAAGRFDVPAEVFGDFAAHPPYRLSDLAGCPVPVKRVGWRVSHVPSGMQVIEALPRKEADALDKANAIAWARAADFVCTARRIDTKSVNVESSRETMLLLREALIDAYAARGLL